MEKEIVTLNHPFKAILAKVSMSSNKIVEVWCPYNTDLKRREFFDTSLGFVFSNAKYKVTWVNIPDHKDYFELNLNTDMEHEEGLTLSYTFNSIFKINNYERDYLDNFSDMPVNVAIKVNTPVIKPDSGNISIDTEIFITCKPDAASIFYTVDGTDPTRDSIKYETPFKLTNDCSVKARGFLQRYHDSDIATNTYHLVRKCATPVIYPEAVKITPDTPVSIRCATSDARIYYTTDGIDPDDHSKPYVDPFTLKTNTTLKAIAYKTGYTTSDIVTKSYIVEEISVYARQVKIEGAYQRLNNAKQVEEALVVINEKIGVGSNPHAKDIPIDGSYPKLGDPKDLEDAMGKISDRIGAGGVIIDAVGLSYYEDTTRSKLKTSFTRKLLHLKTNVEEVYSPRLLGDNVKGAYLDRDAIITAVICNASSYSVSPAPKIEIWVNRNNVRTSLGIFTITENSVVDHLTLVCHAKDQLFAELLEGIIGYPEIDLEFAFVTV